MTKVPPQGVPRKTSITQGHGLWSLRVSIRGERIVRAIHAEADLSPRLSGCNGNVRDRTETERAFTDRAASSNDTRPAEHGLATSTSGTPEATERSSRWRATTSTTR